MDWKWWARGDLESGLAAGAGTTVIDPDAAGAPQQGAARSAPYGPATAHAMSATACGTRSSTTTETDGVKLVVCELAIPEAIGLDPRAGRTLANLLTRPLP